MDNYPMPFKNISRNLNVTFSGLFLYLLVWLSLGEADWKTTEVQQKFQGSVLWIIFIALCADQVLKKQAVRQALGLRDRQDLQHPYYVDIFLHLRAIFLLMLITLLLFFMFDLLGITHWPLRLIGSVGVYLSVAGAYSCVYHIVLTYKK